MSDPLAQASLDTPTPVAPPVDPAPAPAPAPDPAPAPAPAPVLATADPAPTPTPSPASPKWPENWREEIAGNDEKKLKQLQRYSDPIAAINKGFALEAKLSSGEYKPTKLPENATPEQVAEWRKEMGLPDSEEGYKPELPNGIVLGQTDQEVLEGFKKHAFEHNLPPEIMNKTLAWYFSEQDRVAKVRELQDADFRQAAEDELIGEWGVKNHRANIAAMATVRDQMPQGLAARVLMGRTADGRLLGDDPQFLKWFSTVSRELYPAATVVGLDGGKTVEGELDQIRKLRREDPNKYEQDFQLQARERELLDAQIRAKSRKA